MEITDLADALRALGACADQLAERYDLAEMAGLHLVVAEQASKAQRDDDLIAELRKQLASLVRTVDAISRARRNTLAGPADIVQVLAEALMVIDGDCSHYGGSVCRTSGRTRRASGAADTWCTRCVARDALERAGALPAVVD